MTMRHWAKWCSGVAVLACLVVSIAGCGGGTSAGAATATEFAKSYCDLLRPCCASAGFAKDGKQCQLFVGFFATNYDPKKGATCLNDIKAASTSANFCELTDINSPACTAAFATAAGTKKPGETCEQDDDCAPDAKGEVSCETRFAGNAQIRKCQTQIAGKEGDSPCTRTVDGDFSVGVASSTTDVPAQVFVCNVADGLSCSSKTSACTKIQPVGGMCSNQFDNYACVKAAYCDQQMAMCLAKVAVGQSCSTSKKCVEAAFCDDTTSVCIAKRAAGAACMQDEECVSTNCVNLKCDAGSGTSNDLGLALICGK